MSLLSIPLFFSGQVMRAISWTLVHSLWQGLLLAILAGVVILCTGKARPSLRYNLLTVLFVCFLLTTGVTFIRQWQVSNDIPLPVSSTTQSAVLPGKNLDAITTPEGQAPGMQQYMDRVVQFCNQYAVQIVAIWFFLFVIRFLKMLSGLGKIQRLRHNKTHVPADNWKEKFTALTGQLGIRQSIALLESEIVKVPVVIGFLKPMVLVPLGLLTSLPADEAEAILLHELAHIRRRDYLVNLLQSIAETIFFFNPGILWLSSLIREERENCCDDIAVQQTSSRSKYIHALVSFEEYRGLGHIPQPAMAFAGRQHHLLNRVKRIVHNENKKLNTMEKSVFTISILLVVFLAFMSMEQPPVKASATSSQVIYDTVPERKVEKRAIVSDTVVRETKSNLRSVAEEDNGRDKTKTVEVTKDGIKYRYKKVNNRLTELSVDGKSIPESGFSQYHPVIEDIEKDIAIRREENEKRREALKKKNDELRQRQAELRQRERQMRDTRVEAMKIQNEKTRKEAEAKMREREVRGADIAFSKKEIRLRQEAFKREIMEREKLSKELLQQKQKQWKISSEQEKMKLKQDQLRIKEIESSGLQRKAYEGQVKSLENARAQQEKFQAKQQEWEQKLSEWQARARTYEAKARAMQTTGAHRNRVMVATVAGRQQVVSGNMDPLIRDLMNAKVIDNENNLSVTLNSNKLVVNGRRQPAALHQKLKEKYLRSSGDVIQFSSRKGSRKINIKVN